MINFCHIIHHETTNAIKRSILGGTNIRRIQQFSKWNKNGARARDMFTSEMFSCWQTNDNHPKYLIADIRVIMVVLLI